MDRFTSSWQVRSRSAAWPGLRVEHVEAVSLDPHEFEFRGDCYFVAFGYDGTRADGETAIDGGVRSRRCDFARSVVFVPQGLKISGWSVPRKPSRWLNLYIDPTARFIDPGFGLHMLRLEPQLHVAAEAAWRSGEKIAALLGRQSPHSAMEAETLCSLLLLELAGGEAVAARQPVRGGLGNRRAAIAESYIRDHLHQDISLATIAAAVELTPNHFLRAFRDTFGMPPHAYVLHRRLEKAKDLLADRSMPITTIALATGFGGSSHFATAFKKGVGVTPSRYRAGLL